MEDVYNRASERLWEKIEYYRNDLNLSSVNLKQSFPMDQLIEISPLAKKLLSETEKEFNIKMSEFQCSWAVWKAVTNQSMESYNKTNNTSLTPRA